MPGDRHYSSPRHKRWREAVREVDPVLASVMVPECVYRGFCPELRPCGYADTEAYQRAVEEYRRWGDES